VTARVGQSSVTTHTSGDADAVFRQGGLPYEQRHVIFANMRDGEIAR
jgi:ketosteroid isomerase-like protein